MARRTYINEMTPNQLVAGVFTMQNCQLGLTKGGKAYLKCLLVDRTGRSPGRMWNCSEDFVQNLPTDGFVHIEGQTQPYQGEMQIIIQSMKVAHPTANDLLHLLPSTEHDIDEMFGKVKQLLQSIEHEQVRVLAEAYLADEPLMSRFRQAPAAMTLHHAYLGGLLEHTLNLMSIADRLLPLYPDLNRDIVLFGLFLHDLGKTEELNWQAGFSYSDDGQLIGHVARGVIWLEDKARAAAKSGVTVNPELLRVLQHIILSHHGQPEFGALKLPATPEAIFIHQVDNIDAKVHMALAVCKQNSNAPNLGGNFSEKVWALGTRIYRADPLACKDQTAVPAQSPAAENEQKSEQPAATLPGLNIGGGKSGRKPKTDLPLKGGI